METSASPAPRTVWYETYGCQMNELDAELVLGDMARRGWSRVGRMEDADVLLVNTCSIREHAEDKVWSLLGRARLLKRRRPEVKVAVMGCMAQRVKEEVVERAPHVDLVLGTSTFRHAVEDIEDLFAGGGTIVRTRLRPDPEFLPDADRNVTVRPDRFRAYVNVVRGCNHACSYCIVPFTRGREVSRPIDDVMREVRTLVDDGVREITFLGQNINTYGCDLGAPLLPDLLDAASRVDGLDRLRFLTSNPFDMTEGMMRRFGEIPKVMPWLHIPAQSGSDAVLGRMKRTYTVDQYREVVGWARRHIPDVEITSDFIVGFSGETDAEFEATAELVREIGFLQTYVFKYSLRPRTHAARQLPDDVPESVKRQRNIELLRIQDEGACIRNQRLVGRRVEILVEGVSKTDPRRVTGRDTSHRLVHCDGTADLAGHLAVVEIAEVHAHSLVGRLVSVEGTAR